MPSTTPISSVTCNHRHFIVQSPFARLAALLVVAFFDILRLSVTAPILLGRALRIWFVGEGESRGRRRCDIFNAGIRQSGVREKFVDAGLDPEPSSALLSAQTVAIAPHKPWPFVF